MVKKKCNCKDWEINVPILSSSLEISIIHGINIGGLNKNFEYCPWCGKKLIEGKE